MFPAAAMILVDGPSYDDESRKKTTNCLMGGNKMNNDGRGTRRRGAAFLVRLIGSTYVLVYVRGCWVLATGRGEWRGERKDKR